MKLNDITIQDRIFEIQKDQEVSFRIISPDYEYIGLHWSNAPKGYFACTGKDKGCPFCAVEDKPIGKYITYIDDGAIKLAQLPYTVLSEMKKIMISNPEKFKDGVPQFVINAFRSGEGKNTSYVVEVGQDNAEIHDLSSYQTPAEYVELQKKKTLELLATKTEASSPATPPPAPVAEEKPKVETPF